jgi:hypothetical protein
VTDEELAKLRKDLERVYPGGTVTLDARHARELLEMAEAKTDPWRMFRHPSWPAWAKRVDEALAHHHERLTALEEANPPPAVANPVTVPGDYLGMLQELYHACRELYHDERTRDILNALDAYHNGPRS